MAILTKFERLRLLQTIVFFAQNVAFCGKIKLFKLLYLFDFEHFKQTGKSATGLDCQAWKFGPVPVEVMEEWDAMNDDLGQLIRIVEEVVFDYTRQTVNVKPGVQFDDDEFTPRQLSILQDLVTKYNETFSPEMIDVTHAQNGAWSKVWQNGQGRGEPIPYSLALSDDVPHLKAIQEIAVEQAMYRAALTAARQQAEVC